MVLLKAFLVLHKNKSKLKIYIPIWYYLKALSYLIKLLKIKFTFQYGTT